MPCMGKMLLIPQSSSTVPKICSVLGMRCRSQPCHRFFPLPENKMLLLTLPREGERDPKAGGAQLCEGEGCAGPVMLFTGFCLSAEHPYFKAQPLYISIAICML